MKKICILILSLFFILNCNTSAFAASTNAVNIIEIFDDGSYIEEQIENIPSTDLLSVTSTKSGHKTATYKSSSGKTIWTITVSATFTYNGISSKCTKSTVSTTCPNSNWKITSKSSKKSGATATATATATKYINGVSINKITRSVSLTCSKSGKLS